MDTKPVSSVKQLASKNQEFANFLDFLLSNEFIFICKESELSLFPSLKEQWFDPSIIKNLLLFRGAESGSKIIDLTKELESLGLQHVQIFAERKYSYHNIQKLVIAFSELSIRSVEVFAEEDVSEEFIKDAEILSKSALITLTITNCNQFKIIRKSQRLPFNILYLENNFSEILENQSPDPNYFTIDLRLYMESLLHNTFFNKKLIVNQKDEIITHMNGKVLANLRRGVLSSLLKTDEFKKLWGIKKEHLKVCKDCEFRHMCVDSRAPHFRNGQWEFESECDYDPYTGKWAWSEEKKMQTQ